MMISTISNGLNPYGPIISLLFELDSDGVQDAVELAGMTPDWTLTKEQAYSHRTRKRVYRKQTQREFDNLPYDQQEIFLLNIARDLNSRPHFQGRLNDALRKIGWDFIKDRLIQVDVINPHDLLNLHQTAHEDLAKAAERLPSDPSGAVTSACGAVDSACVAICGVEELREASLQEKVKKAMGKNESLTNIKAELMNLGWEENRAKMFCENLKGAINQAAYVMQTLRSEMGDVHGTKPFLSTLAFDSIKWAMIISSLLHE